jgi:hypothetical protein
VAMRGLSSMAKKIRRSSLEPGELRFQTPGFAEGATAEPVGRR